MVYNMGLLNKILLDWLNLSEDKATKLKAIMGGFFIVVLSNLPMADIVLGWGLKTIWTGYLILAWNAFLIMIISLIVMFFGKPPDVFNQIVDKNASVDTTSPDTATYTLVDTDSTTDTTNTTEWTTYDGNAT